MILGKVAHSRKKIKLDVYATPRVRADSIQIFLNVTDKIIKLIEETSIISHEMGQECPSETRLQEQKLIDKIHHIKTKDLYSRKDKMHQIVR